MDNCAGKSYLQEEVMNKKNISRVVQLFGYLISAIALVFVGKSFLAQKEHFLSINYWVILKAIFVGSIVYLVANGILVMAWSMLLKWVGAISPSFLTTLGVYSRSQILKYIPGNILYLPSRHLLSVQQGMEHGPLIGAATLEIVGLLGASSTISVFGILSAERNNIQFPLYSVLLISLFALASPLIIRYVLSRELILKRLPVFRAVNWGNYASLMAIWALYLGFFVLLGSILLWITGVVQGAWKVVPLPTVFSVFAISWLLGFITPGAPAGAGVREGIIILILSNYVGEPAGVLISFLMRIITVVGDLVFYFFGLLFTKGGFKS